MEPHCLISRVSTISAKPYLVFNKAALGELLMLHRKDRIWLLATRSHWFVSCFPILILRSDTDKKKNKNKRMNLGTEYLIDKTLCIFPFPAALFSAKASRQHLPPHQETSPAAGRSKRTCIKKGGWRAGPGKCLVLPCRSAWAIQLLLWISWSTCSAASSSLSHNRGRKGLAPSCGCIQHFWPPLSLGHWHYFHIYFHIYHFILMRKQRFLAVPSSSILNNVRLILQPPPLLY